MLVGWNNALLTKRRPSIISRPDKCDMFHVVSSHMPNFHNGSTKVYRNNVVTFGKTFYICYI